MLAPRLSFLGMGGPDDLMSWAAGVIEGRLGVSHIYLVCACPQVVVFGYIWGCLHAFLREGFQRGDPEMACGTGSRGIFALGSVSTEAPHVGGLVQVLMKSILLYVQ